jgi:predicted nucleotide-binding protein (sugar kinase/HSP70/actin superfamily)
MENRVVFTEEMAKDYTILIPQMAPFHFELLSATLNSFGYKSEVINNNSKEIAYLGNKYVHNDTCVPAIYVIGQFLDALNSGHYDVHKVALIITQTGGGCRASNYIHLLRSALKKADYGFIPVISLNASNIESNPGFKLSFNLLKKLIQSITLGDLLMLLYNQTIPYETNKGTTKELSEYWINYLSQEYLNNKKISSFRLKKHLKAMINDFNNIPITNELKVKVGIVGEIYVKYSPLGNNNLEDFLINEGCEVKTLGIVDFILYTFESVAYDIKQYGNNSLLMRLVYKLMVYYVEHPRKYINSIIKKTRYAHILEFKKLKRLAQPYLGYGTHVGEGWLLTAEIIELIQSGINNIITTQPFGCLPNHIVAKGMFKTIKEAYPKANLGSIDYDTSASKINQENRIKLLLMNAKSNLHNQQEKS